jgi:hypothetical protein
VRVAARVRGGGETPSGADTFADAETAPARLAPALRMVADGREALLASLSPDGRGVRDAVWTRSAFVARTMHDALAAELFYARVERGFADGLSVDEVESAFERSRELREMV